MNKHTYLGNADPAALEMMYRNYLADPASVDPGWKDFFAGFDFAVAHSRNLAPSDEYATEFKVINMINAYRERGHLFTKTNPVRTRRKYSPTLDIENFGLTAQDLNIEFHAGHEIGIGKATLKTIIEHLQTTYCQSVGAEFMFIRIPEIHSWLKTKMESSRNSYPFSSGDKKYILEKLGRAVFFEKFIHKKFPGQKRFSLEGAESLIPALEAVMEGGANLGAKEFIIGMPHRGRLNVLTNIMKKAYQQVFSEFEGKEYEDEYLLGDVKYHLGFTSERTTTKGKKVKMTLAPNPSHLETVDPVVEGIARARIDRIYNGDLSKVVPVLIHGDASVAGQGIVYEVIQMSQLNAYKTGGTIHLVVNNQIGFTTNYTDARSSTYCTDIAKVVHAPVFHVNGDDPEAVVYSVLLAMEFREKFHRDVFIDLLCYRKYGHNEGDEPRFTQPILYKIIEKHPNPFEIYSQRLIQEKVVDENQVKNIENHLNEVFEKNLEQAKEIRKTRINFFLEENWVGIRKAHPEDFVQSPATAVNEDLLLEVARNLTELPGEKKFFRKIVKLQQERNEMAFKTRIFDWAMGELLAYGTLVKEGYHVRMSGQDCERGTFSHRHAVLTLEDSEEKYIPLQNISKDQAKFEIYNSHLSEYGVLGFEYGYALENPDDLTIWEAQFGDFHNGAQIIIDQYISSAEDKWNVMNDLVLFLPHGYEGQGPEHSSARIERFLVLCAENNMQIVNCTTPANLFHVLRRQVYRQFRKPLVIFTPKSLLRHPKCVSPIAEFTSGGFREVIDDPSADPEKIKRLVFSTGKIFYELAEERDRLQTNDTALIRLEQIYPFPSEQINQITRKYSNVIDYVWTQEEPVNMGAWFFVSRYFKPLEIRVVARPASGSPATGSSKFHVVRQKKIIDKTFKECDCPRVNIECRMVCIGNKWQSYSKLLFEEVDVKA